MRGNAPAYDGPVVHVVVIHGDCDDVGDEVVAVFTTRAAAEVFVARHHAHPLRIDAVPVDPPADVRSRPTGFRGREWLRREPVPPEGA